MKRTIVIFGAIAVFTTCNLTEVKSTIPESVDKYIPIRIAIDYGNFADSSFIEGTNLNELFKFKKINASGEIEEISKEEGIKLIRTVESSQELTEWPIVERKKQNKAIITFSGRGLWGMIWGKFLLNLDTKTIEKASFDHNSEAPGIGAKITKNKFTNQFIGLKYGPELTMFTLVQDGKEKNSGNQSIDGISGATATSKGAIEMINKSLIVYANYMH
ncbi:MAG: FMN-binding protein [Flavobacteriales bacterium]|nr:FMN-binding protein [Flavobacteriales bacterium]